MKNPFRRVTSAMESATGELQQMRGHIAALRVELAAVRNALLSRDEAVANIDRALDHLASRVPFDALQFASPAFTAADTSTEAATSTAFPNSRRKVRASCNSDCACA